METQLLSSCGQDHVRARATAASVLGGDGVLGCAAPSGSTHPLEVPYPGHPPALWHRHLGLLQPGGRGAQKCLVKSSELMGCPLMRISSRTCTRGGESCQKTQGHQATPFPRPPGCPRLPPHSQTCLLENKLWLCHCPAENPSHSSSRPSRPQWGWFHWPPCLTLSCIPWKVPVPPTLWTIF